MMIGAPEGTTRVLGKSQGYLGLPVRDELIEVEGHGQMPCVLTVWQPTPAELARLNAGASIHVRLMTSLVPPMLVDVGEAPN
jgi:hypothetical protein